MELYYNPKTFIKMSSLTILSLPSLWNKKCGSPAGLLKDITPQGESHNRESVLYGHLVTLYICRTPPSEGFAPPFLHHHCKIFMLHTAHLPTSH